MLKRLLHLLIPLIFLLGASAQAAPDERGTFTLRIPDEPETLDWNKAHTEVETYILMNIMEGLVSFDSSVNLKPALASKWTISSDGKTFTFNLRTDVKWSDGVPLKAQDFVYSWRRLLSPLTASTSAYLLFDVEGAKEYNEGKLLDPSQVGVKAINDHTLQVKLTHSHPNWIYVPTFWVTFPLRQDLVEKYGQGWATPGRMVTLGPYELAYHDLDQRYGFVANTKYYGKHGNIKKFFALIVKDNNAAIKLYEEGKIDFLNDIASADLKRLLGRSDLKIFPYLKTDYLAFSTNLYPFDTPSVRHAIGMAINRAEIKNVLPEAQPAGSFVPPPLLGYSAQAGLPFDPVKARAELAATGFNFQEHKFTMILPDWERAKLVAEFIQSQLKKNLGLELELVPMKNQAFRMNLDLHASPFFLAHWAADFPDPDNFLSIFLSTSGDNRFSWKNPEFDQIVNSASDLTDQAKRKPLYTKAQKILLQDQTVVVPLYYEPIVALVQKRVHGLVVNPVGYLLLSGVNVDH